MMSHKYKGNIGFDYHLIEPWRHLSRSRFVPYPARSANVTWSWR